MYRTTRTAAAMMILTAMVLCAFPPRALADAFAGNWKVKIEPDEDARKSGEKDFDDTFYFKADKFYSDALKKRGFAEAKYDEDSRRFGPAAFTVEQKSDKEGKAKWSGTITSTEVTGELTITKTDGTQLHFTYKGSRS